MCRDWYSDFIGSKIGVNLNFTRNYMDIKHKFYLSLPGEVERGATRRFSMSHWWFARQQAKQTPLPGNHSMKYLKKNVDWISKHSMKHFKQKCRLKNKTIKWSIKNIFKLLKCCCKIWWRYLLWKHCEWVILKWE